MFDKNFNFAFFLLNLGEILPILKSLRKMDLLVLKFKKKIVNQRTKIGYRSKGAVTGK